MDMAIKSNGYGKDVSCNPCRIHTIAIVEENKIFRLPRLHSEAGQFWIFYILNKRQTEIHCSPGKSVEKKLLDQSTFLGNALYKGPNFFLLKNVGLTH
jgi:hypothetical protein